MEAVNNFQTYKDLITGIKENGKCVTNCYLFPAALKQMIEAEKLFYICEDDILLFFLAEETFYRCYYYISERYQSRTKEYQLPKPSVIELPFQGELLPKYEREISIIQSLGFVLGRESQRMFLPVDKVMNVPNQKLEGVQIDYAAESESDIVYKMLCDNLNVLYANIPTLLELKDLIREKNVLCLYEDGIIKAILDFSKQKSKCLLNHLVVTKESRGKGYAEMLINEWHQLSLSEGDINKFEWWVDIHNIPAVKVYKKGGSLDDNQKANEYILV